MVRRVLCPAFKRFFELHERLPLGRRSFSSSWDRWSAVRGCDPHARICFPTKPPASDRLDIFSPTHPCSYVCTSLIEHCIPRADVPKQLATLVPPVLRGTGGTVAARGRWTVAPPPRAPVSILSQPHPPPGVALPAALHLPHAPARPSDRSMPLVDMYPVLNRFHSSLV